ncbi:MAG: hypothetical protein FWC92_09105 [Defluviitaleaceae bacterium]|nr:hypothetical protein [Defluviitaleaceae bacterium]
MKITRKSKRTSGFTLMEAIIALAVWMILAVSVLYMWNHMSNRSAALLARQSALENARGAMDVLITNIQMAKSISLNVGPDYVLRHMLLPSYNPDGNPHVYRFDFNVNLLPTSVRFRRLEFGQNELVSNIALVRIQPINGQYMHITIKTGCEFPIILEGSVDIRYKILTVNGLQH